jgi:hypothetical protein
MKNITINALAILFLLASCDSVSTDKIGKVKSEEKLVKEYCKTSSDKNFFRASATIKHQDLGQSEQEAIFTAKDLMAQNIKQTMKNVTDRSFESRQIGNKNQYNNLIEGLTRATSEVDLGDVKVICTKVIRMKEEGLYQRFVAIEMSKEEIIKDIENKISKDDAMYQDYRRNEMRKILAQEF